MSAHVQLHSTDVERRWGKVTLASCKKKQKPHMKEKGGIPKAASNRAGFHPAFGLPLFDEQGRNIWMDLATYSLGPQLHDFSFWSLCIISHLFAYSWREKELIIYFSFWNPVCGLDFTSLKLPLCPVELQTILLIQIFASLWKINPQLNTGQKCLFY